ncbi:hypothetical protein [Allorhodopirellula heiligendammensis]|uniref:Chromosome partition protein Smc n=1 Tax=Allorhodopirellula heiligendammensis TaxID=2714739 RepID=A0A5C6C8A7_9BACT|nr:hypothetical protein [Allorhodopirellula heiligendammensis]TWU19751.1 hypothetical protein Poly21_19290 [Allorhodopirellula heiligendammensis]
MNLLGKSFSVLILLLSVVFMVMALAVNASHRNWRDVVMSDNGLKAQIETYERTNNQLREARARTQADLDRERVARRTALAALETKQTALAAQLSTSEGIVQQEQAKNTELAQLDRSRAEELEKLTAEAAMLRSQIRKEQQDRDNLFAETLKLTDDMNSLRGIVQLQQDRNDQLLAQVTRYKEVVDAAGLNMNDPLDGSPPDRNGNVLVINRPRKLVEVSIGYDDGLREGHLLEVSRGGRYVSRLRVRKTEPDRAVAEILNDYSEGAIQEGDRVDTTIE